MISKRLFQKKHLGIFAKKEEWVKDNCKKIQTRITSPKTNMTIGWKIHHEWVDVYISYCKILGKSSSHRQSWSWTQGVVCL